MEVTDKSYNEVVLESEKPIFIDCYSPMCGPCQDLKSFLNDGLIEYAEKKDVLVITCDISKNPKIAEKLKVQSVPFTICVTKDKKFKYPELGLQEAGYYFKIIDKISGKKKFLGLF